MARCGCGSSCSCLIVAGDGARVDGIGTVENPYVITSDASQLLEQIEFVDTPSVDFTVAGLGTLSTPLSVSAVAKLAMTDLIDVQGSPELSQVPVWVGDHWEFQDQTGGGGGGSGLPNGGTTGQMLVKQSAANGDAAWRTMVTDQVILRANVGQTMTTSTEVSLVFQAAVSSDPLGMWDGSSLVTVQRDGLYEITMNNSFMAVASPVGSRITLVRINGSTYRQWYETVVANQAVFATHTFTIFLTAGATIQARQYQSQGANLDTHTAGVATMPSLHVTRLGDGPTGAPLNDPVMGERVYSSARAHTVATSIVTATYTPIPFNTEQWTDGITWNGTDAFVVPVTGYYQVDAVGTLASNATGVRSISVMLNGTFVDTVQVPAASSGAVGVGISATVKAVAGDLISVRIYQNSGVNVALATGANNNYVAVTKVPAPVVPGRAASGLWGSSPLDKYGTDSLVGREIFVDANGQLRSAPTVFDFADNGFTATTSYDSFPNGLSVLTFNAAGNTNWPVTGVAGQVTTTRRTTYAVQQFHAEKTTAAADQAVYFRAWSGGSAGAWGPWLPIWQDTGWLALTGIASGWTVPSPYVTPQARLLNGEVKFRGRLVNASFTGGYTDLAVLPAGIPNPAYASAFPMATNTPATRTVQVLTTGVVQTYSSATSASHLDFASVRYLTT